MRRYTFQNSEKLVVSEVEERYMDDAYCEEHPKHTLLMQFFREEHPKHTLLMQFFHVSRLVPYDVNLFVTCGKGNKQETREVIRWSAERTVQKKLCQFFFFNSVRTQVYRPSSA